MYRLLVIDDEEIITDSLVNMLEQARDFDLDVYKAYSAGAALEMLEKAAFEIVITDIQMPGVSGIELLKKIHGAWPDCQVIVFSGYDEFEYASQALRYHAARYVLKAEGYDALRDALGAAVAELEKAAYNTELLRKAEDQLRRYLPLTRQSFLEGLLSGTASVSRERFKRLEIGLDPGEKVTLLGARAAAGTEGPPDTETLASVGVLLREKTGMAARIEAGWMEGEAVVFLIQPREGVTPERARAVIKGRAELLERLCANLLKARVSFVYDSRPMSWEELPPRFAELRRVIEYRIERRPGFALAELEYFLGGAGAGGRGAAAADQNPIRYQELVEELRAAMAQDNRAKLRAAAGKAALISFEGARLAAVEFNTALNLTLLSYVTTRGLEPFLAGDESRLETFLADTRSTDAAARVGRFLELADQLFALNSRERVLTGNALADRVLGYIRANLGADLSLYALSEKALLNPSYLSRRFKEITGRNLIDTVTRLRVDEACRLLRESALRVSEIAPRVGFESAAYFSRLFKRRMGMTPQEYRGGQNQHAPDTPPPLTLSRFP